MKRQVPHSKIAQQSEVNTSCINDHILQENEGEIRPEEGQSKEGKHHLLATKNIWENCMFETKRGKDR